MTISTATSTATEELVLQGDVYDEFMGGIKSEASKTAYNVSLRRYMNHIRLTDIADLLKNTNPRYIQSQITGYIESLKEDGISCNTIKFLVAPIFTFYDTFDITLNRKNVLRHLPEFKRVVKDSAYTTEQIQQA